jgi:hypothetical protein
MKDSSNNIRFSYLYRDAGNYKLFGEKVFNNPENLSLEFVKSTIQLALIDGEFFIAEEWNLPKLEFEAFIEKLDHQWHEFKKVETTTADFSDSRSVAEFLNEIKNIAG